jgi:1,4-dihydroxy-2-naphthoyl-CoA hydrolase
MGRASVEQAPVIVRRAMSDQPFEPPVPFDRTFDALYGLEVLKSSEDEVRAQVPVREAVMQPMGLVHGGVYASIAEAITSMATAVAVMGDGKIAVGLSNQTSFLRPITEGTIHALARRRHRGRTTWIWEVDITDDAGHLCALVRMTIAVRDRPQPR